MKRIQNEPYDILEYMKGWIDTEDWSDLQCMFNAAMVDCPDALEYMADHLMGSGAINPKTCYEWAQTLEQDVELLASRFRKLSKKRKDLAYDRIFDGVLFIDCQKCNHVCFVHDGNEKIYPELTLECWKCRKTDLVVKRYEAKKKGA